MPARTRPWTDLPEIAFGNSKLADLARRLRVPRSAVGSFDLPAGWTCPAANECMARADRQTGHLSDGPHARFRCYAASGEAVHPTVRAFRWHNLDMIRPIMRDVPAMVRMLTSMLAEYPALRVLRIHSSGDYLTREYLHAWIAVARQHPGITFYGYTKVAHWLPSRATLPANMRLIVSHGGRFDNVAHGYPVAIVIPPDAMTNVPVYTTAESERACMRGESYALVVHGTQPALDNARDRIGV